MIPEDASATQKPQTSELVHDVLNFVAAAKLNTEMALRNKQLPEAVRRNLERVAVNLLNIHERMTGPSPVLFKADEDDISTDDRSSHDVVAEVQKTILVVDDSSDIRSLFKVILKPYGYMVTVAKNVDEALSILSQAPFPHLMLLDYTLGEQTAKTLLDELEGRRSEVFAHTKIVMLTGYGDAMSDSRVLAVEQKSMDAASLVALVKNYLKTE